MSRYKKEIVKHLSALMQEGPIEENKNYIQHGDVTVFDHCIAVAEYSCRIAEFSASFRESKGADTGSAAS